MYNTLPPTYGRTSTCDLSAWPQPAAKQDQELQEPITGQSFFLKVHAFASGFRLREKAAKWTTSYSTVVGTCVYSLGAPMMMKKEEE